MPFSSTLARRLRRILRAAYCAAAILVGLGIYQGWILETDKASTDAEVIVLVALFAATMMAERAGVFTRPANWTEIIKLIACWTGAAFWVGLFRHTVPDSNAGTTILAAPACALFLAGTYYMARIWPRYGPYASRKESPLIRWLSTSKPLPAGASLLSPTESLDHPPRDAHRVDIAAAVGAMTLRKVAGVLIIALAGTALQIYSHSLFPVVIAGALGGCLLVHSLWILTAGGPALSFGPAGLTIRPGLSTVREVRWPEIRSFELRSAGTNAYLVVHLRDAESLIARQGVVGRWLMLRAQRVFGTPVGIPTSWMKYDRNRLLHTATTLLATHGEQNETRAKS